MALPKHQQMTAEEFLRFAGEPGKRYELIDGGMIEMAPAGAQHGAIAYRIGHLIGNYVFAHSLGELYTAETGFVLRRSPDTIRAPDFAFVSAERLPDGGSPEGYLDLAPDLVVEVISPSDTARSVQRRIDDWLKAEALVVVVVYPEPRTVFLWRGINVVERRTGDEEISLEPALPSFRCKVSDFFPS